MKQAKLVLANFDARIPKIKIKAKNKKSEIIISSKMYDEETDKEVTVKIHFNKVAAIDFRINFFDCMVGAEAFGLYKIKDKTFIESIAKSNFNNRKEIYLSEGDYNYDENDSHDLLNCFDTSKYFKKHIDEYSAYIQNVDGGVYIIIAKSIKIER